jgi:D-glycero-alpha-D-manno-heptose-7-phosphate kinase
MLYRSKAPLRIGLAGGGTDVSPYSDEFGGVILNVTLSLYAHTSIELLEEPIIFIESIDKNEIQSFDLSTILPIDGKLDLVKGVYNRIQKDYPFSLRGFKISTKVDAPAGSGLGTSSTLVVSILGAFKEMLKFKLNEYEIAHYAYEIERIDLALAGGKQDQYAATFGGFNFMEFSSNNKVIVNPLRIRQDYINELENNLVLYFTSSTRESATIIKEQQKNVLDKNVKSIEAMHHLKDQAKRMKEALLMGKIDTIGEILDYGFQQKKEMASNISNDSIESIYQKVKKAGATGGKISGAGGGGFMIFYCPKNTKHKVIETLNTLGGTVKQYSFTEHGLTTWTITE